MSTSVRNLEPKPLWNHFADLNAVPRASKKEERVIQFMLDFGKKLGLPTMRDEVGNVIIKKPATEGMAHKPVVALQGHLDMVHQKNNATHFDFDTEGIKMVVEGDWVRADGTTLGADNGIGVASIMALLASSDIPHPPLEALFTIDEETGMSGALGFKGGLLDAKYLLNLDTEDDRVLTIGCAGGVDVTGTGKYAQEAVPSGSTAFKIGIKGLEGGHSGLEIHIGKGNANKLMNRLLYAASQKFDLRIAEIDGGGLRNAIPRESFAVVVLPKAQSASFEAFVQGLASIFQQEYQTTDPGLSVVFEPNDEPLWVMKKANQTKLLQAVYSVHNGIYRMSSDIKDLVQTSNNLARVLVKDGTFTILCLTRSSVGSEKDDLAQAIGASLQLAGAKVVFSGSYPGWAAKPTSDILLQMSRLYEQMFAEKPKIKAGHAGLECGILGTHYPDMQMISFGPNIRGAHSPDEKVQVSSVQKFWSYLVQALKQL